MPFFKAAGKLVYYAHVPKCGGTSVASYLTERFGPLAFQDRRYLSQPEAARWTRSSPQHVDAATLERLIPLALFDACFSIVRHPVARIVSIYHFQQELETRIPSALGFSDWLGLLEAGAPEDPFRYDNHTRPMTEIVPEGAVVFHMEHGLDRLIPWFDLLTGDAGGPRLRPRLCTSQGGLSRFGVPPIEACKALCISERCFRVPTSEGSPPMCLSIAAAGRMIFRSAVKVQKPGQPDCVALLPTV